MYRVPTDQKFLIVKHTCYLLKGIGNISKYCVFRPVYYKCIPIKKSSKLEFMIIV